VKMHESLTPDRIMTAVENQLTGLDDPGFCIACGADAYGVEPDARRYKCEACGEKAVYGAQELALRLPL
jgi:hypothetical protein